MKRNNRKSSIVRFVHNYVPFTHLFAFSSVRQVTSSASSASSASYYDERVQRVYFVLFKSHCTEYRYHPVYFCISIFKFFFCVSIGRDTRRVCTVHCTVPIPFLLCRHHRRSKVLDIAACGSYRWIPHTAEKIRTAICGLLKFSSSALNRCTKVLPN